MIASRRLPGIAVGVAPSAAVEALPRMDVALFVGFASTGPIHAPVAVESVTQFVAVFGPDAPLAWDETRGERVYAYLGPSVRAFFANGGRRCWIVRVAQAPVANAFPIAGVLSVAASGTVMPARAAARCEGSWSDDLRVASALLKRRFAIDEPLPGSSPSGPLFTFRTRFGLRTGDLIELEDGGVSAYATVDSARATLDADGPYAVEAHVCAVFERVPGDASSPPLEALGSATVQDIVGPTTATLKPPIESTDAARIVFEEPVSTQVAEGHWVRWSDGGAPVWLLIENIERAPAFTGSPLALDPALVIATVSGPAWREVSGTLPFGLNTVRRAHLLSIDLRVDGVGERLERLTGVGLTPSHSNAWWSHISDADFYRQPDGPDDGGSLESARPERARFPLVRTTEATPVAWLPLGVTALFGPRLAPLPQSRTALERDGLAAFGADLFLDRDLARVPVKGLPELADAIRFVREPPRTLTGLHAGWSVGAGGLFNEVSLLAVPDAIHLGWHKRIDAPIAEPEAQNFVAPAHWHTHRGACAKPEEGTSDEGPDFGAFLDCSTTKLNAPVLQGPVAAVPPGTYQLSWTDSEPFGSYVLFEFTQADLSDARQIYDGPLTEYVALNSREGVYYYQVVARRDDERSASSNTVAVRIRSDAWVQNRPTPETDAVLDRQWLAVHRAALRMAAATGDVFVALSMPRHFRTAQALRYARRLRTINDPPGLADPEALDFTEARALSYGALYFPWLQSGVRATESLRTESAVWREKVVPPDGIALGVMAARATGRGAWIAPANEPLQDVVAATPVVPSADWQALLEAQINLIRNDPRGFLALAADTLSRDVDLRPINVRRLLILLRRLALRRGISYVFEPNGPVLRRAIQRGFEVLLTDLFRRGAFAGAVAEKSFRVVTDDTINTPRDADAGRLIVELRVAPSIPMRFLAVQLAQSGARLTVSEEL